MQSNIFRSLSILLLLLSFTSLAKAQTNMQRPPPDLLPIIQMTQVMVTELKATCLAQHPELKDQIEQAHREWILYPVKIVILVNDKEYVSPSVDALRQMTRNQLSTQDRNRTQRDCEDFRNGLNKMLERVPKEALTPFLPGPAK